MTGQALFFGALALLLWVGTAAATPGTVLRDETLHAQPNARAATAGSVAKGAGVTVLARQGGWLRVTAGNTTGWIRLLSVRVGGGGLASVGLGDVVGAATHRADPSRVVAVAGLRGLGDDVLRTAKFNGEELARMETFAVTPAQARAFAGQRGLASLQLGLLPPPPSRQASPAWGEN